MLDERFFRNIAEELGGFVDAVLWEAENLVALGEIHKFADLDNVGDHARIRDRYFVRQPGDTGTVRSARRDKDLEMEILLKLVKDLNGVLGKTGLCFGNIDQAAEQDRKFVAR